MKSASELRTSFLEFFAARDHTIVPSASLLTLNDPSLMFVNAGMVPFKDAFTGREKRSYVRATSSQKCMRISGKHNDLENVGVTPRHHTFFEMLGNFSLGDYFKREAIDYAWELLTKVWGLDPERMVITVFGGEKDLPADEEAAALWADATGFSSERIIRCGAKDNFWQMGPVGPCGPCAEVHYALGIDKPDPRSFFDLEQSEDGRGWFELWNNVFMQFERTEDGRLLDLPAPSIDTGMGLERVCVVKQEILSNYDTDLLRPIVDRAAELSGTRYRQSSAPDDVSMRVIADHARTTAFLIAEGITPDRDDRNYVLRRVMRRAIRHGHRLGIQQPFLHDCVELVVDLMGEAYPELLERRALIATTTQHEEELFRRTLKRGLSLLQENEAWETDGDRRVLPGHVAFKLYDTFGFPLDLQRVLGEEQGFSIDESRFDLELQAQRDRSRGSKVGDESVSEVYFQLHEQFGSTRFVGYESESAEGTVLALVAAGTVVAGLGTGEAGEVLVDTTPFYAEQGGQEGDRGVLQMDGAQFQVEDTVQPRSGCFVHRGRVISGTLDTGAKVTLSVDPSLRMATRRNHSATHLLHWALRETLGPAATQQGSLVGPNRLRFDYSGTRPLSQEEILEIEDRVNQAVFANTPVTTEVLPLDEAKARGALGIFEEKYGAVVRMLRIGPSLELCGGTHAFRTGDIGLFKILSESGVAAGVRRIEASTGWNTVKRCRELERVLEQVAVKLKTPSDKLPERVQRLMEQTRESSAEVERLKRQLVQGDAIDLTKQARSIDGVKRLGAIVDVGDAKALREMAEHLRDRLAPAAVLLGSKSKDGTKALLACSVSKEVIKELRAGDLVREAARIVGGGGGGRPDFAQAGGSKPECLPAAVAFIYGLTTEGSATES